MVFIYNYPLINILPKDIKVIISEYMDGNIDYGEVVNEVECLYDKKLTLINKLFHINKKLYNETVNTSELFEKYINLLNMLCNPLKNGMPLFDDKYEFFRFMNYPYEIIDWGTLIDLITFN